MPVIPKFTSEADWVRTKVCIPVNYGGIPLLSSSMWKIYREGVSARPPMRLNVA